MREADVSTLHLLVEGPGARGEEASTTVAGCPVSPAPRRRRVGRVGWFGRRRARRGQRGMVTVEFVTGLVILVTLVSTLTGLVLLGMAQSGIQTVSSKLAKYLSWGDDVLAEKIKEKAPEQARIEIERVEAGVRVTTRMEVLILGLGTILLETTVWVHWEPGVGL